MSKDFSTEFATLLAQGNAVLKQAADALNVAVEGVPPPGDFQRSYICRQAVSVASVALDAHLLASHQRFQNVVGLCRIGFESRISIYAAMRVPEFAAQKYLAGAKANVKQLQELIQSGVNSAIYQSELENQQRFLAEMRRDSGGIQEKTWWRFEDVAKAAGLMADYEAHYATLSKATHNTPTGLAAKTDDRILVSGVLNLLHDAVETCAALVFFQIPGNSSPRPLTKNWEGLVEPVAAFQREYGTLNMKLNDLTNETIRHPET